MEINSDVVVYVSTKFVNATVMKMSIVPIIIKERGNVPEVMFHICSQQGSIVVLEYDKGSLKGFGIIKLLGLPVNFEKILKAMGGVNCKVPKLEETQGSVQRRECMPNEATWGSACELAHLYHELHLEDKVVFKG